MKNFDGDDKIMNEQWINKVHQGHVLNILKQMPSELVDCVITSPPYWALRDYKTEPIVWDGKLDCEHEWENIVSIHHKKNDDINKIKFRMGNANIPKETNLCSKCSAWKGSLGLEPTFDLYIKHLCDIFDEVKRVMKKTGTLWVNLGDTYSGSQSTNSSVKSTNQFNQHMKDCYREDALNKETGLTSKSLCMIPYRFAIEMVNRGWILRNVLIWKKPNCMPSSAKDRFTVDFEYLFFFAKNKKYFFETQYEPFKSEPTKLRDKTNEGYGKAFLTPLGKGLRNGYEQGARNKRTVWTITTKGFSESHFAVFPEELVETPIKAGCPEFVCSKCGKAREKIYKKQGIPIYDEKGKPEGMERSKMKWNKSHPNNNPRWWSTDKQIGYSSCSCNAPFVSGIVMDIFMGSGTTAKVAKDLKRDWIGIELNGDYVQLVNERVAGFQRSDWKAKKTHKTLKEMIR